jgi:hypothetical protein
VSLVDSTAAGVTSTTLLPTTTTTAPRFISESWETFEEHAVVGRVFPAIVWTGTELVVWGGEKPSETTWHGDGAAFDATSRNWRELAVSPLAARSEHVGVWTGSEVVICCGRIEGSGAPAGAYDPVTDSWREIDPPPISPAFAQALWTGSEMVVFGGVGGGGTANLTGAAAFNPDSGEWRRLADLPYGIERTASSVLGDGLIYVWPSPSGFDNPGPLSYDIANDTWTQLPAPPEDAPGTASVVWTGTQLFAYGASQYQTGEAVGVSLVFDPAAQSWTETATPPLPPTDFYEGRDGSEAAVWADNKALVWSGWVGTSWDEQFTNVIAYDPESDVWTVLDPAPVPAYGLWNEPIVWTGHELIAYSDPMVSTTP